MAHILNTLLAGASFVIVFGSRVTTFEWGFQLGISLACGAAFGAGTGAVLSHYFLPDFAWKILAAIGAVITMVIVGFTYIFALWLLRKMQDSEEKPLLE